MVNLYRKRLREYAMSLLIFAALAVIIAATYFHQIQALLPIAALLLALRIFLTSADANVRRLSGIMAFCFGASTLSNVSWYLVPATVSGGSGNEVDGNYSTIAGGISNQILSQYSAIPGGYADTIRFGANYSLAFGNRVFIDTGYAVMFYDSTNPGRLGVNRDDHDGGVNYPIHVGTSSANGNGAYLSKTGQWTNGSSGYLATEKAVRGGGYSAVIASTRVGPQGGQVLVDRSVELVNSLW